MTNAEIEEMMDDGATYSGQVMGFDRLKADHHDMAPRHPGGQL